MYFRAVRYLLPLILHCFTDIYLQNLIKFDTASIFFLIFSLMTLWDDTDLMSLS